MYSVLKITRMAPTTISTALLFIIAVATSTALPTQKSSEFQLPPVLEVTEDESLELFSEGEFLDLGTSDFNMSSTNLFGLDFVCTTEQRVCSSIKTVYHRKTRSCHLPGSRYLCPSGYFFAVSRERALRGDIAGACVLACPEGYWRPAIHARYRPYICQRRTGSSCRSDEREVKNIFGEDDCKCKGCVSPWVRTQPASNRCRLPNIDTVVNLHDVPSSCRDGQVSVNRKCYMFLKQGPCKVGEWLVADSSALVFGHIKPVCVRRPCSEGEVKHEDGKCHSTVKDICESEFGNLELDITGVSFCKLRYHTASVSLGNYISRSPWKKAVILNPKPKLDFTQG